MNLLRSCPSFLLAGALASIASTSGPARADEIGGVVRVANRCDIYGSGFVDLGGGMCSRVRMIGGEGGRNRIDADGQSNGASGSWTMNGTSNAALRNDGGGMLPGLSDARHLRIQNGTDVYAR